VTITLALSAAPEIVAAAMLSVRPRTVTPAGKVTVAAAEVAPAPTEIEPVLELANVRVPVAASAKLFSVKTAVPELVMV